MSVSYPVQEIVPQLKEALLHHRVVILQAPPGAGKSTVLPLMLLDEPWLQGNKMIMLEPRKLAARSVAHRMASLRNEDAGETIGYRVRFESVVSGRTRCEVVTEGILTRMLQNDNALEGVNLVIFDEFHERSLHADLALALCLQAQNVLRDDLRILIMSATLDGEKISSLLGNAPIITSLGRQYPVSLRYAAPDKDTYLAPATARVIRKALTEQQGDILTFLPGTADIHRVAELLETENSDVSINPLYGDLPFKKQQEAITPHPQGKRKVVLATSIAETSLTIEGITTVVDSGYARVPKFDPRSGLTRLETIRVTRDAADQRSGRAGRLGPGIAYRMWPETLHHTLQPHRQPEILEADLAPLMLELANWGVQNINELTWITPPPAGAINQAKELLQQLGATVGNVITARGREMLRLPTHPRIAHMLLEGGTLTALATDIAALLEERDPMAKTAGADVSLRVEVLRKWRAGERVNADRQSLERVERVALSWRKIFKIAADNAMPIDSDVGRLLAEAYPERIARQMEKSGVRYKLANGRVVRLPDHDPLMRETWLAVAQLDSGTGEGKIFLAAPLDEEDLVHRAEEKEVVSWNAEKGMITAVLERRIGNALLATRPLTNVSEALRIKILCEAVQAEGLKMLPWEETHDAWQARVMSLRTWRPDDGWPDVSAEHLLQTTDEWLAPYLQNVTRRQDFNKLPLDQILAGLIPWNLNSRLDVLAPPKLSVPSGSMIKLHYASDGRPPFIEVRLQEVFGLQETPAVNEGRNKIILHLLSPGYKPVQVTQDLKSFWQTTYHEVRKEMRMRYPRHHWPEDPWTAEAVRGAKRRNT
ncbi:ATP-dependent helicase HrpB [Chryseolinea lacunae]|uniref:ATP-dependent helicase HrpB n=1 Tax=Chryseolinea lacunae TaxID=2801331 RepID=A0ABS1KLS9_9BACT|nr:ATP-dependent helicase HrpB [Chryseolinea lacunae]MBL0740188.1 ATP-dependent helicase HrpB [Chryseolinea lacunae]